MPNMPNFSRIFNTYLDSSSGYLSMDERSGNRMKSSRNTANLREEYVRFWNKSIEYIDRSLLLVTELGQRMNPAEDLVCLVMPLKVDNILDIDLAEAVDNVQSKYYNLKNIYDRLCNKLDRYKYIVQILESHEALELTFAVQYEKYFADVANFTVSSTHPLPNQEGLTQKLSQLNELKARVSSFDLASLNMDSYYEISDVLQRIQYDYDDLLKIFASFEKFKLAIVGAEVVLGQMSVSGIGDLITQCDLLRDKFDSHDRQFFHRLKMGYQGADLQQEANLIKKASLLNYYTQSLQNLISANS